MGRETYSPYELCTVIFTDYIVNVLSIPATLEKSNTPQLTEPYFTVFLSDLEKLVHDVVIFDKDLDIETVRGLGLLRFTVIRYGGDNVISDLAKLQDSFETTKFVFEMEQYGFGLSDKGNIINTTAPLIDARFENRAELKCSFYHSASSAFAAGYFNKEVITIERGTYSESWNGEDPLNPPQPVCQLR